MKLLRGQILEVTVQLEEAKQEIREAKAAINDNDEKWIPRRERRRKV